MRAAAGMGGISGVWASVGRAGSRAGKGHLLPPLPPPTTYLLVLPSTASSTTAYPLVIIAFSTAVLGGVDEHKTALQ